MPRSFSLLYRLVPTQVIPRGKFAEIADQMLVLLAFSLCKTSLFVIQLGIFMFFQGRFCVKSASCSLFFEKLDKFSYFVCKNTDQTSSFSQFGLLKCKNEGDVLSIILLFCKMYSFFFKMTKKTYIKENSQPGG